MRLQSSGVFEAKPSADITLVVPAAGRGTRLYPDTRLVPKGMLRVGTEPILKRVLDIGADVEVSRIIFVVGPSNGYFIRDYFGSRYRGIPIDYVVQHEPRGIADAVNCTAPYIDGSIFVVNGDEVFVGCDHAGMRDRFHELDADGVVGFVRTDRPERICSGYGMDFGSDGRVERLIEKPARAWNDVLGVGAWFLKPSFFRYVERTDVDPVRRERDFVAVIQWMIDEGRPVWAFDLRGDFVNVNTCDELDRAELLVAGGVKPAIPALRQAAALRSGGLQA